MALQKTVTKTSVRLVMKRMWALTLTLTIVDDDGPGFTRTFSRDYKEGHNIPNLAAAFKADMQAAIEVYKAEQVIFKHAHLDALVVAVQDGLEVV